MAQKKNTSGKAAPQLSRFRRFRQWSGNTTLIQSLKLFFSMPKNIIYFLIIDIVLLAVLLSVNGTIGYLTNISTKDSAMPQYLILIIALVNILLIVLFYSYAKMKALNVLFCFKEPSTFTSSNSSSSLTNLTWQDIKKLYTMNLLTYLIIMAAMLLLSGLVGFIIKQEYSKSMIGFFGAIVFFFLYIFISISHIRFVHTRNIKASMHYAWKSLHRNWAYLPILNTSVVLLIFTLIAGIISMGIGSIAYNMNQNLTIMKVYTLIVMVSILLLAYLLHLFSRIYYLKLINEDDADR